MVRFVVIGEGHPAKALLNALLEDPGALVQAVVLREPGLDPLADIAAKHRVAVADISRFSNDAERLAGKPGCWLVNVNSTYIIPPHVLRLFDGRSLNFHPGLLPEYAGLHTHQWAIRNGEREFGVTVHRMEERVDTGAIVGQLRFPIDPSDTGLSLYRRCLAAGAELFPRVLVQIIGGERLCDVPQDLTRRRLYRQRDALDGRIDWSDNATRIIDFIRAGNYEPFASPTYVAHLDTVAGFDVQVLEARREAASGEAPGTVIDISTGGPLIVCGDGAAIRVGKARRGRHRMDLPQWQDYVSRLDRRRLQGRMERSDAHAPAM